MSGSNILIDCEILDKMSNQQMIKSYPIDLNADVGEGANYDTQLMQLITSANIACGGHTGDHDSMTETVKLAIINGVKIGAHPSYPDTINFGRKPIAISAEKLANAISQQIINLKTICEVQGAKLSHIKPHGALYNESAINQELGQLLIDTIKAIDPSLALMTLAASPLSKQAKTAGLTVIEEAFADRAYLMDGTLAPRALAGAVIEDKSYAALQVEKILTGETITTLDGHKIIITADSICLHGDTKHALTFAKLISEKLR